MVLRTQIILLTTLMIGLFVSVILLMNNRCEKANEADINIDGLRRLADLPGSEGELCLLLVSSTTLVDHKTISCEQMRARVLSSHHGNSR